MDRSLGLAWSSVTGETGTLFKEDPLLPRLSRLALAMYCSTLKWLQWYEAAFEVLH